MQMRHTKDFSNMFPRIPRRRRTNLLGRCCLACSAQPRHLRRRADIDEQIIGGCHQPNTPNLCRAGSRCDGGFHAGRLSSMPRVILIGCARRNLLRKPGPYVSEQVSRPDRVTTTQRQILPLATSASLLQAKFDPLIKTVTLHRVGIPCVSFSSDTNLIHLSMYCVLECHPNMLDNAASPAPVSVSPT
jgi:hypothetical protein